MTAIEEAREVFRNIPGLKHFSDHYVSIFTKINRQIDIYLLYEAPNQKTIIMFEEDYQSSSSIGDIWEQLSVEQQKHLIFHLDLFE